jgi:hypothetical protein
MISTLPLRLSLALALFSHHAVADLSYTTTYSGDGTFYGKHHLHAYARSMTMRCIGAYSSGGNCKLDNGDYTYSSGVPSQSLYPGVIGTVALNAPQV